MFKLGFVKFSSFTNWCIEIVNGVKPKNSSLSHLDVFIVDEFNIDWTLSSVWNKIILTTVTTHWKHHLIPHWQTFTMFVQINVNLEHCCRLCLLKTGGQWQVCKWRGRLLKSVYLELCVQFGFIVEFKYWALFLEDLLYFGFVLYFMKKQYSKFKL